MTADTLRAQTRKQLERMARRDRVAGWHDMTKEQLVRAILRSFRARGTEPALEPDLEQRTSRKRTAAASDAARPGESAKARGTAESGLPRPGLIIEPSAGVSDSLNLTAVDAGWLHVQWTVSPSTLSRAQAALGPQWRTAATVIRLYELRADEDGRSVRTQSGDVAVRLEEGRWFVRLPQPGRKWSAELGLRTTTGRFQALLHSVGVSTLTEHREFGSPSSRPAPAARIMASARRRSNGGESVDASDWQPTLQAELRLAGATHPLASIQVQHEPVPVSADGGFVVRVPVENGRLVLPVEATSPDGAEKRMVVVALDLNIRQLETQMFDELGE